MLKTGVRPQLYGIQKGTPFWSYLISPAKFIKYNTSTSNLDVFTFQTFASEYSMRI